MDTIGKRIRAEREAQGIDRKELAAAAGIAPTTIAGLETGDQKSTTALHKIANRLNVSVEWLETGAGPKHEVRETSPQYLGQRPMFMIMADAVTLLREFLAIRNEPADRIADPLLLEIAYEVVSNYEGSVDNSSLLMLSKRMAESLTTQSRKEKRSVIR